MSITDGILESLIQDGRTINLIQSYLHQCCNIEISLDELKKYIDNSYTEQLIQIAFPPEYAGLKQLNNTDFEDYWFELSEQGEKECIRRNLMLEGK